MARVGISPSGSAVGKKSAIYFPILGGSVHRPISVPILADIGGFGISATPISGLRSYHTGTLHTEQKVAHAVTSTHLPRIMSGFFAAEDVLFSQLFEQTPLIDVGSSGGTRRTMIVTGPFEVGLPQDRGASLARPLARSARRAAQRGRRSPHAVRDQAWHQGVQARRSRPAPLPKRGR